jgi:hypothetical protein
MSSSFPFLFAEDYTSDGSHHTRSREAPPDMTSPDGGVLITDRASGPLTRSTTPPTNPEEPSCPTSTLVLQSTVHLRPGTICLRSHGKGKERERRRNSDGCGAWYACDESDLSPPGPDPFGRLRTGDVAQDLRRWLLTPNSALDGARQSRRVSLANLARLPDFAITRAEAIEAILFSVEECALLHEHMAGLARYGSSHFYLPSRIRIAPHALPLRALPTLEGLEREDLTRLLRLLLECATELDYLNKIVEEVTCVIWNAKWQMAQKGDEYEIEHLLQLGVVSKMDVMEFCGVPK